MPKPSDLCQNPYCKTPLRPGKSKCHACGEYNVSAPPNLDFAPGDDGTRLLSEVVADNVPRLRTGPWDKNFGYCGNGKPNHKCKKCGIAISSVAILAGGPGVGKSTIGLQIGNAMAGATGKEFFYVGAEEDAEQVKDRAVRLEMPFLNLIRIVPLENIEKVSIEAILEARFGNICGVVVDSTQVFARDPEEAVELCLTFKRWASKYKFPFIAISQVTKEEEVAGKMQFQHAGDTTILASKGGEDEIFDVYDDNGNVIEVPGKKIRMFDTDKNRFGPADEEVKTHFLMTDKGLKYVELAEEDEDDGDDE